MRSLVGHRRVEVAARFAFAAGLARSDRHALPQRASWQILVLCPLPRAPIRGGSACGALNVRGWADRGALESWVGIKVRSVSASPNMPLPHGRMRGRPAGDDVRSDEGNMDRPDTPLQLRSPPRGGSLHLRGASATAIR
jgi:hypothetical protein